MTLGARAVVSEGVVIGDVLAGAIKSAVLSFCSSEEVLGSALFRSTGVAVLSGGRVRVFAGIAL